MPMILQSCAPSSCLTKSKRKTKKGAIKNAPFFVIPLGLEPKAYCLEGSCSIQLSYGTIPFFNVGAKVGIFLRTAKFFVPFICDCVCYATLLFVIAVCQNHFQTISV